MKILLILTIVSTSIARALDLTPIEAKASNEAGEYSYLEFRDGRSKVTYMPPKSWDYRGDASCLRLSTHDVSSAEFNITHRPLKESLPVAEENLKAFEEIARQSLPQGALKAETETVLFNPMEIDGHKTIEVVMCYSFFGQMIKSSLLFAVRESAPVRFRVEASAASEAARSATLFTFRVAARPGEFQRVRKEFFYSLNTIVGL